MRLQDYDMTETTYKDQLKKRGIDKTAECGISYNQIKLLDKYKFKDWHEFSLDLRRRK